MKKFVAIFLFSFISICGLLAQALPGSGNTLLFNGINNYINLGTNNRNIDNKVTAEAWIKTTNFSYQWIIGKYVNAEDRGFHLFIQNGKAAFAGRTGNGSYFNSGYGITTVSDGKWHHLAGIFTGTKWEIWVDGQLEKSASFSITNPNLINSAPLTIGNYFKQTENYFNGEIDEVRLWNTVRSDREIKDNMCRKLKLTSPDLVGYYKLDEGTGISTADQSSFNIPGALTNFSTSAWRTSGAAIGDISTNIYTSNWNNRTIKTVLSNNDTVIVQDISANARGIHIYRVNSIPNISPTSANSFSEYFGVFSVGTNTNVNYTLSYKVAGNICNTDPIQAYKRPDNSVTQWQTFGMNFNPGNEFSKTNELYRSEYIIPESKNKPAIHISGNSIICPDSTTTLTASTSPNYLWNNGEKTQRITINTPGKYYVSTVSVGGCISSDTITVTSFNANTLILNLGPDTLVCIGNKLILDPKLNGYLFKWQDGSSSNTYSVTHAGTYWVDVSIQGCPISKRDSIQVNFKDCSVPLFIPNIITPNNDSRNDAFEIIGLNTKEWSLLIFNRWGVKVYQTDSYKNGWQAERLTSGVYYYYLKHQLSERTYNGWIEVIK